MSVISEQTVIIMVSAVLIIMVSAVLVRDKMGRKWTADFIADCDVPRCNPIGTSIPGRVISERNFCETFLLILHRKSREMRRKQNEENLVKYDSLS